MPIPVAEYQEWPFQGFLKRTRIGTETIYNLEFRLPSVSECLNLPIESCDDGSNEEVLATPSTRPKVLFSFQDLDFGVAASGKGQVEAGK
jgi:hypothetical protein